MSKTADGRVIQPTEDQSAMVPSAQVSRDLLERLILEVAALRKVACTALNQPFLPAAQEIPDFYALS